MEMNTVRFADALRAFRKEERLSLDGLAFQLEVSRGTIVNWENGVSSPSFETCKALFSMGMNFIVLLKSDEDIRLDRNDADNLAGKLKDMIQDELNLRVYGLNMLDKLSGSNRQYLNSIVENLLDLSIAQQEVFLKQTSEDLDSFIKIGGIGA